MYHCNTGPGAWVIGQGGGPSATGPWDRTSNVLKAMVDWIEEDVAPETIEGVKYVNDTVALGVSIRRKHCKYVCQP
jgi:feruloyl esterase